MTFDFEKKEKKLSDDFEKKADELIKKTVKDHLNEIEAF
jgi:ribosome recycling factor